jgi:hypothetical protein
MTHQLTTGDMVVAWLAAKDAEAKATERRRHLEDVLTEAFAISEDFEGTTTKDVEGYKVKITGRLNRKIDSDLVQQIAAENGTSAHLSSLFRWKPELNMSAWKSADKTITEPLLKAVTTTPGRPSYAVTAPDTTTTLTPKGQKD